MAKEARSRGSIIYKLLIVILAIALVATILFPKSLWNKEARNTQLCRENMEHILYTEYVYLSEKNTFTDTLSKVVDLIKNDTTGGMLRNFENTDSLLSYRIMSFMKKKDTTAAAIIDTLKEYGRLNGIDTTAALILDSLRTFPEFSEKIDSIALATLDNMSTSPTVHRPYFIQVVDTSAIKIVNIKCPLDSLDSLAVTKDFKLGKIGGLRISNHGAIENGEKSWTR
ncbi:MAG: hypothetical protein GWP06_05135 [Actinobacteria bacterium]|nr:hypothetical protein [Actinomycetota bacterium]